MAFTYPPTGSGGTTSSNEKAIKLITGAPAGWYGPKGYCNLSNNFWDKNYVTLIPHSFDKDFEVTDWSVLLKNWGGSDANFLANGGVIRAAVYSSDDTTFAPTDLFMDMGNQSIPTTDPGMGGAVAAIKTLDTPITLLANKVYWVGLKLHINDGEGGFVSGSGPSVQQFIPTGAGVASSIPAGDNNLAWSYGEKGGIYDDANSSAAPATWVSTHSGLYPFVSWASADLVAVQNGFVVHLKGSAV